MTLKKSPLKLFALACSLLLSSCVYYSVQRDLGGDPAKPCTKGSTKQNEKCKAELKAINASIESANNN